MKHKLLNKLRLRVGTGADAMSGRFSRICKGMRTDIRKQANISVLFL